MGSSDTIGISHSRRKPIKGMQNRKRKSSDKVIVDDDSGLGDSSYDGESISELSTSNSSSSSPIKAAALDSAKPTVITPQTFTTINPTFFSNNFGCLQYPSSKDHHIRDVNVSVTPKNNIIALKRLRLDPPEEANELPEEKSSPAGDQTGPQIVSFKNVPAILSSLKPVQSQSFICFDPIASSLKRPATCLPREGKSPKRKQRGSVLDGNYPSKSSDGSVELKLLSQPEDQHRARYQTEGSRGAVKDRSGQGHPTIKLFGYTQSCILQVFVASDGGVVSPHLFYQACKVSGKNSTSCQLEKITGTAILNIALLPDKDMTVSCDCVGILKERNVDVEQRMNSCVSRGKKKSTKCRLVFRTVVVLPSGAKETLQTVSQTISCTQPPGVPEICKKSLSKCNVTGGEELYIVGKNLKDAEVLFQEVYDDQSPPVWMQKVTPDKEHLQHTHLICEVPPYRDQGARGEVKVQVVVVSCGRASEPSPFKYLPVMAQKEGPAVTIPHQQSLPKGVSPSAVELNRRYTESGGGLALLDDPKTLKNSDVNNSLDSLTGIRRQPLATSDRVSRALAMVTPEIRTKVSLATRTSFDTNTFTTATVLRPLPSLSPQQDSTPALKAIIEKEQDTESNQNMANLITMLKLVRTLKSGDLRTSLVDLLIEEILSKMKKEKEHTLGESSNAGQAMNPASIVLTNKDTIPFTGEKVEVGSHSSSSEVNSTLPSDNVTEQFPMAIIPQQSEDMLPPTTSREYLSETFSSNSDSASDWVLDPSYGYVKINTQAEEKMPSSLKVDHYNKRELLNQPIAYNVNGAHNFPCKTNTEKQPEIKPTFVAEENLIAVKKEEFDLQPIMNPASKTPLNVNVINTEPIYIHSESQTQQQIVSFLANSNVNSVTFVGPPLSDVHCPNSNTASQYPMQNLLETTSKVELSGTQDASQTGFHKDIIPREPQNMTENIDPSTFLSSSNQLSSIVHPNNQPEIQIPESKPAMVEKNESPAHSNEFVRSELLSENIGSDPLLCQTSTIPSSLLGSSCTPNSSIAVTVPADVTSAISNLSENELLNYINPNCFDNV